MLWRWSKLVIQQLIWSTREQKERGMEIADFLVPTRKNRRIFLRYLDELRKYLQASWITDAEFSCDAKTR